MVSAITYNNNSNAKSYLAIYRN